ncbi:hypothetical protein CC1G_00718 [Coprinopsis cinerea okayama7|uniref:Uncharacterized protein n=1 Tax=Coprinopsis cinerea (strain Okayama-7 / 130 / ATCC MYA-4618 / FGSC 9003) TaxID=240176 RepID=A8N3U8_COPC7|nr:hypothetical protein CC1G_00718 [Coprinopsis cinerea okayama7\|eukprot:XP_001829539.1 hypothetical protein CC1G_00718 [Coprinopsis cinerea okayama7\
MARFTSFIVGFLLFFCNAWMTLAAPVEIEGRQLLGGLGGIGCNLARIQTVTGLRRTIREVDQLAQAAGADTATANAAANARTALDTAQGGINQIAVALFSGNPPPQAGRDITEQGFNDAKAALNSITSTDPAITAAVAEAQADLDRTISAGQRVVARC